MFKIDNKEIIDITESTIKIGDVSINRVNKHGFFIQFRFNVNGEKGYFNLDGGYFQPKDITFLVDKEFQCVPWDSSDTFTYDNYITMEIYDTNHFYDTEFTSIMKVSFKEIKNHRLRTLIYMDDPIMKIEYNGYLDIK